MTQAQLVWIAILLVASVAFLVVPTAVYLAHRIGKKSSDEQKNMEEAGGKSGISHVLIFSACLLGSVWCLRFAVGLFETDGLNCVEKFFNSFVHALQTFSMDEDYTDYITSGKDMLLAMLGRESAWQTVYGIYAAVLNLAAPIAGGAIVFEIIAGIFPKIRLYLALWRDKYYFSELNEASLALAKSIAKTNPGFFRRPAMIFTDVYVDDESEKDSELLLEARRLGGICIKDDLAHIHKTTHGSRKFFLIDENESGNLHTLTALANSYNNLYIQNGEENSSNVEVYLFTNDDAYIQVEKNIRSQLKEQWKFGGKEENLPFIMIPVKSYRNMITNLLSEQLPLYEPLIGKEKVDGKQQLAVTILGTGDIGVEMFLTTYWIGQILDCKLTIRVLSQETEEAFWDRIDYVNPEIRETIEGGAILRINRNGDMAEPYCTVKYQQCDVKSSDFIKCLSEGKDSILDTDYYFVALGSDEDDLSVANTIHRYVGQHHISAAAMEPTKTPLKTVIAYVVYDSELSNTLNHQKLHKYIGNDIVYMCAVGSLRDVYSFENVFMTRHEASAEKANDAYLSIQNNIDRDNAHRKRVKDDYKHWATLAQSMHEMYKVYSSGVELPSKLAMNDNIESDEQTKRAYKDYLQAVKDAKSKYNDLITGKSKWDDDSKRLELIHKLAWLEHRRWNAFTRVKGFRWSRDDNGNPVKDYDTYAVAGDHQSYKQMELKLHPCLVESDKKGIRAKLDASGQVDGSTLFGQTDRSDFDYLDELSYDLHDKDFNGYNFKQYDYPTPIS